MPQKSSKPSYKILPTTTPNAVPSWARRPPKWEDLIATVLNLHKGQTLPIEFEDAGEANRARNTVRDTISRETGKVALQTRVVTDPESEKTTVYFTMLLDEKDKPQAKK